MGSGTPSPPSTAIYPDSVQREKTDTPISQFLPRNCLTAYVPSCCLRVWLLISLYLGLTTVIPFGTLTDLLISLTTKRHEIKRQWLEQSQRFARQPRIQAGLIHRIHLLRKTNLPRLKEALF